MQSLVCNAVESRNVDSQQVAVPVYQMGHAQIRKPTASGESQALNPFTVREGLKCAIADLIRQLSQVQPLDELVVFEIAVSLPCGHDDAV